MQIKNKLTLEVLTVPYPITLWGFNGNIDVENIDGVNKIVFKYPVESLVSQIKDLVESFQPKSMAHLYTLDLDYTGIENEETETGGGSSGGGGSQFTEGQNAKIADWIDPVNSNSQVIYGVYLAGKWNIVRYYNKGLPTVIAAGCGKNILSDTYKIQNLNIPDYMNFDSVPDTNLNGLFSPENFPVTAFLSAFPEYIYSNGYFISASSGGGDPVTDAVPVGVTRWDSYAAWDSGNLNGIEVKLASGFSNQNINYRNFRPFHAYDVTPQTLSLGIKQDANDNWNWIRENRYVDMNFDGDNQTVMDQEIAYAIDAGISYFVFLFYADGASQDYARQLFVSSTQKNGLKCAYDTHGITHAANINGEPVNTGYANSIATIVSHMSQSWYMKINNKPIVVIDVPWNGESLTTQLDRAIKCKQDIQAGYGGSDNIYFVLSRVWPYSMGDNIGNGQTVWQYVAGHGFTAINWYSSFGNESKTYAAIAAEDVARTNEYVASPFPKTVPCLTTSFHNKPMKTHPFDNFINLDMAYAYNELATNQELDSHIREMLQMAKDSEKIDTIFCYSWNEHYEGCKVICPTKLGNNTVNREVIDVFKNILNP